MSDRPSTLVSRSAMEMAFALLTMVFGATVISGALEFSIGWGEIGPEAGYFPFRIGTLIVLASLVNLVRAVKRRRAAVETILTGEEGRRLVAFALPVLAFVGHCHGPRRLRRLGALPAVHRRASWRGTACRSRSASRSASPLVLFVLFEYACSAHRS